MQEPGRVARAGGHGPVQEPGEDEEEGPPQQVCPCRQGIVAEGRGECGAELHEAPGPDCPERGQEFLHGLRQGDGLQHGNGQQAKGCGQDAPRHGARRDQFVAQLPDGEGDEEEAGHAQPDPGACAAEENGQADKGREDEGAQEPVPASAAGVAGCVGAASSRR